MQIKLLVSAAAIALVAGLATAHAAEKFTTLDGVSAVPMDAAALANTVAGDLFIFPFGNGRPTTVTNISHNADGGPNQVLGIDLANGDLSACGGGALCDAFAHVGTNFPVSSAKSDDVFFNNF